MKKTPLVRKTELKRSKPMEKAAKARTSKRGTPVKIRKPKAPSVAVLDDLFSRYIRRFGSCELHGVGEILCSSQMQCSHIISRRFHSVRWNVDNAICSCAAHHRWQHDFPHLNARALEEIVGTERLDRLEAAYKNGKKPTPAEKIAIAAWLRAALRECAA